MHWPFCLSKCPYCDFNSHVRHRPVDQERFVSAFAAELKWFAEQTPGRGVSSIFFGGGTPSLMEPETIAGILEAIHNLWSIQSNVEITLEANPTSVEAENFSRYRTAGVNRVSVGVQALDDRALKMLGRQHTSAEALDAFRLAAKTFDRVSFDMIYARPKQTAEDWAVELEAGLKQQEGHMSLYQLTIEPETRFVDLFDEGKLTIPGETEAVQLYDVTQELTAKAGLSAYEVSNHALPGHECRHNLLYWTYGEYAGVGPGAHSRLRNSDGSTLAIDMIKSPEVWIKEVDQLGAGINGKTTVPLEEMANEYLLMGMRLSDGIDLPHYASLAGHQLETSRLNVLREENLVTMDDDARKLAATPAGRRVLNAVVAYLTAD